MPHPIEDLTHSHIFLSISTETHDTQSHKHSHVDGPLSAPIYCQSQHSKAPNSVLTVVTVNWLIWLFFTCCISMRSSMPFWHLTLNTDTMCIKTLFIWLHLFPHHNRGDRFSPQCVMKHRVYTLWFLPLFHVLCC